MSMKFNTAELFEQTSVFLWCSRADHRVGKIFCTSSTLPDDQHCFPLACDIQDDSRAATPISYTRRLISPTPGGWAVVYTTEGVSRHMASTISMVPVVAVGSLWVLWLITSDRAPFYGHFQRFLMPSRLPVPAQ
ncbi:hypothetical protein IW262DRAFT_1464374 [Armillaria fumosa]|nr:hypothetical protein IW262DRAFT_1464374 [Armillaria fumosa]